MLREETVEPGTLELLKKITSIPELSQFRLVGGTALSLLLGHRKSIDLDLFTDVPFDKNYLNEILEDNFYPLVTQASAGKNIMQCTIQHIKVDFVCVKDTFNYPPNYINNIPIAHIEDICALKLNAIKGRGSKKDFWDIHKLLQSYSLENLLTFYLKRYPYDDTFAVIRSLIYFEDAENETDPICMENTKWEQIKITIEKAFKEKINNK